MTNNRSAAAAADASPTSSTTASSHTDSPLQDSDIDFWEHQEYDDQASAAVALVPPVPCALTYWKHYDFIEVGTSDWGTLTQYCGGDWKDGCDLAGEIRTSIEDLKWCRGLAV